MSSLLRKFIRRNNTPKLLGPLIEDAAKASSTAYVAHPATDVYSRIWGMFQFDDLNKYYQLYYNVPFIKSAVDITADMVVRNGWEWEGGRQEIREFLQGLEDELNVRNFLREYIRLGLVYGTAYAEIIYENPPPPITSEEIYGLSRITYPSRVFEETWVQNIEKIINTVRQRYIDELKRRNTWGRPIALKPLDSRYIRVLGDSKGIIWGFIQLAAVPYVYIRRQQMLYWSHEKHSELYEYFYGTSILRPILRIQAIITQLEEDLSLATHFQAYTPIKARVGDPQNPLPETKFREVKTELEARKPGGNIIVPGYVDVEWMPLQQTLAARMEWFFKHLLREREQALGIPRLFFGEVGGVSRGSAELLLQEFEARLKGIQEGIVSVLMEQLYLPTLMIEFPDLKPDDVPKMVCKPIITGELRQKVISAIEIIRSETVPEEEKAKALEHLKDVIGVE